MKTRPMDWKYYYKVKAEIEKIKDPLLKLAMEGILEHWRKGRITLFPMPRKRSKNGK